MSGPVATEDTPAAPAAPAPATGPGVWLEPGRVTRVGSLPVREAGAIGIGPHPHMGLQTVTWVVAGELLHRDSLGSEQLIRPGQLNLMTAGHGVAHAEEDPGLEAGELHAVQLWVAQPEGTRHRAADFEHHADLPRFELDGARATVLMGEFSGHESPARHDTELVGVELVVERPGVLLPLRPGHEHALVVLEGSVSVEGQAVEPGVLGYLGTGRSECRLDVADPARALLLGGVPFPEPVLMWWNFVARTREEVSEARRQWSADDGRFGTVRSKMERIEVGPPPWE
jgi:redox-sensitive bicupin YhaK (pirin superfamily)